MGHSINYITVAEKANRKSVMDDIAEHARKDGDGGYSSRMTWHDEVQPFDTKEEAREFIAERDNGWYDDHAVRFLDYSKAKPTAKMAEYEKKVAELIEAERVYRVSHSVHTFKAQYIGCPKCGSKLNKDFFRCENCPLCRTDLRSNTTLDKLQWYADKIEEYRERIEAEKRKQKNRAEVKWLVKYEFHT